MTPMTREVAERLLAEVAGKPHRFALVGDEARPDCAVEVAGWFLVPFVDCGDWDYVDRVITPEQDVYDVDPGQIPAELEDEARNAHPIWQVFNLYPETRAPSGFRCPCGYRPGFCWATRGDA